MKSMIKITSEDLKYQSLHRELASIQIKEMKEGRWYVEEIKSIRKMIKERYDYLKNKQHETKR